MYGEIGSDDGRSKRRGGGRGQQREERKQKERKQGGRGRGGRQDPPSDRAERTQAPKHVKFAEEKEELSEHSIEDGLSDNNNGEFNDKYDDFDAAEFEWEAGDDDRIDGEYGEEAEGSTTDSSWSAFSGLGGNNQVSRKNYCQGPATERIGSPATVMMVAEKPSIAQSITEALCGKNYNKRSGPAKGIPIFTFKGHFKGQPANFKVTSVAGHVYNRDFPVQH